MKKKISSLFTYKNVIIFIIFLLFFIALRWNHYTAPFERDEGVYAYSAWIMRKGLNPYEYSFPYKPPMIIYTYLFGQVIFGGGIWPSRVLASIFSLFTILLVGLIAKKEWGSSAGWISAFLLSVMLILPVNFGRGELADIYYAATTEIFMILPLVLVLYIYVIYKEKATNMIWFLSGVFTALALGYKPIGFLVILYIYIFWLHKTYKYNKDKFNLLIKILLVLLGGLLAASVMSFPFLIFDHGKAILTQLIGFTPCYTKLASWDYSLSQLINRIVIMGRYYWVLYVLLIYYLYKRPRDWLFYFGLLAISFLSIFQSLIGHFYIQVMPFLALIGSGSIVILSKEKLFQKIPLWVIAVVVILTIIWPIRIYFGQTPEELSLSVYGRYDQFYEAEFIGKKISEMTKPDDYVYVEGMDPEILYFANRKHSVRVEWTNFFSISGCEILDEYKTSYINDLEKNTPEVISVCVSGSCSYLWEDENAEEFMVYLSDMLDKNYVPIGGWVPKEKGGYWLDHDEGQEDIVYRTFIYKRKESN